VGLAIISDTFYEHQRGLKVGLWVLAIDMGLLVGLLIGGFPDLVNNFWISWLMAILFAAILIVEVFLLRETLYSRNRMLRLFPYVDGIIAGAADIEKTARQPSVATEVALKRVEMLAFINVKPAPGVRHPKPWDTILRFIQTFKFLTVFFAVWTFCFG
jgi:MFS family permease